MHLACGPQVFTNIFVMVRELNFFGARNVHNLDTENVVKKNWTTSRLKECKS